MRARQALAAALALPVVLLAAGCTSSDGDGGTDDAATGGSSSDSSAASSAGSTAGEEAADGTSAPTPPPLAGDAEAGALASLPEGPATGTAVLTYSGVGELRAAFTGECSHDGESTSLEGTADTAQIRLDVAPDGARLAVDDVGLSATSDLATGRYDVAGNHLSLAAPLVSGGQPTGQVELEVDCAG